MVEGKALPRGEDGLLERVDGYEGEHGEDKEGW